MLLLISFFRPSKRDRLNNWSCNYAQIFLLPLFAETEGILKSNNAATDEVFKNLMSMVITSSLVEKRNERLFMVY